MKKILLPLLFISSTAFAGKVSPVNESMIKCCVDEIAEYTILIEVTNVTQSANPRVLRKRRIGETIDSKQFTQNTRVVSGLIIDGNILEGQTRNFSITNYEYNITTGNKYWIGLIKNEKGYFQATSFSRAE